MGWMVHRDRKAIRPTDDQTLSTNATPGEISISGGNSITLNVDDADADPTNEYNTGLTFDGASVTVSDAGGNQSVDISALAYDDTQLQNDVAQNTTDITTNAGRYCNQCRRHYNPTDGCCDQHN